MHLEKLQQAWQSQPCGAFDTNPDMLLKMARIERHAHFGVDMAIVSFFSSLCVSFFVSALRDFRKEWPWLFYCAGLAWVVGYVLFNRWRHRRNARRYDDSMLSHVEKSIDDIEHQMRLDRTSRWWYTTPITLGCMIPPALFFVMDFGKGPFFASLVGLLTIECFFVACFIFVYAVMEFARRKGLKGQLRQLESLRALRESLLTADE